MSIENLSLRLLVDSEKTNEKLNLLFELKSCLFESITKDIIFESFNLTLNKAINNGNIISCDGFSAASTGETNELIRIFDFDVIYFFREWLATMRAANINISFHDKSQM